MAFSDHLVWLFPQYRQLVLEREYLLRTIADLEQQLQQRPQPDAVMVDMIKKYQDEVLVEQPFPDGIVPDNMWLTLGENASDRPVH